MYVIIITEERAASSFHCYFQETFFLCSVWELVHIKLLSDSLEILLRLHYYIENPSCQCSVNLHGSEGFGLLALSRSLTWYKKLWQFRHSQGSSLFADTFVRFILASETVTQLTITPFYGKGIDGPISMRVDANTTSIIVTVSKKSKIADKIGWLLCKTGFWIMHVLPTRGFLCPAIQALSQKKSLKGAFV